MESLSQVCCSFSLLLLLAPLVRCSPLLALVAVGALLLLPCLCSAALAVLISDLYCWYSVWLLCLCCLCLRSSPLILLICSRCLCSAAPAVLLLVPCCCTSAPLPLPLLLLLFVFCVLAAAAAAAAALLLFCPLLLPPGS